MRLRYANFDDLIGLPGAFYVTASRQQEPNKSKNGLTLSDTKDDLLILEDVLILQNGGIVWQDFWLSDTLHYYPGDWHNADWLPGHLDDEQKIINVDDKNFQNEEKIDNTIFFVDSFVGHYNFGHFVHDTCPYGLLWHRVNKIEPSAKPALINLKFSNQRILFSTVFGYAYESIVPARPGMRVKRMIIGRRQTRLTSGPWQLSFAGVRHIREAALKSWVSSEAAAKRTKKIYFHRTDGFGGRPGSIEAGRNYSNYSELLDMVAKMGFIIIDPGYVSVETIAELVSSSNILLSVHGAGLANLVFAPAGSRVVEIAGVGGSWRSLEALSILFDHDHTLVRGSTEGSGTPKINVEEICRILSE
jgi:hypothetical protein